MDFNLAQYASGFSKCRAVLETEVSRGVVSNRMDFCQDWH